MAQYKDITGQKFGRLTAIKELQKSKYVGNTRIQRAKWLCKCDCGKETVVIKENLSRGITKSCGCLKNDTQNNKTHGMSKTRFYSEWCSMIRRCENKKDKSYRRYGGRGITVCDRWRKDFMNFYEDMQGDYDDGLTLDRIDNSLGYNPSNCRWVSMKQQQNNRTNNVVFEIDGKKHTMSEWCDIFGLSNSMVRSRYHRGCEIDKLFLHPKRIPWNKKEDNNG